MILDFVSVQYGYDSDSDCSIDDCHVCRRVRSVMDGRRRSTSVFHRNHCHHRDRYVVEVEVRPHRHHCESIRPSFRIHLDMAIADIATLVIF